MDSVPEFPDNSTTKPAPTANTVKKKTVKKRKPRLHKMIGLIKKMKAKRNCLSCNNPFTSRAPDNRICPRCKRGMGDLTLPTVYHSEIGEED